MEMVTFSTEKVGFLVIEPDMNHWMNFVWEIAFELFNDSSYIGKVIVYHFMINCQLLMIGE